MQVTEYVSWRLAPHHELTRMPVAAIDEWTMLIVDARLMMLPKI